MANYKARAGKPHSIDFKRAPKKIGPALLDDMLNSIARMHIQKGKPLAGDEKLYVLNLLDRARPTRARALVQHQKRIFTIGAQIELAAERGERASAIAEVMKSERLTKAQVTKAHSFYMRLAGITPRAGKGSEK